MFSKQTDLALFSTDPAVEKEQLDAAESPRHGNGKRRANDSELDFESKMSKRSINHSMARYNVFPPPAECQSDMSRPLVNAPTAQQEAASSMFETVNHGPYPVTDVVGQKLPRADLNMRPMSELATAAYSTSTDTPRFSNLHITKSSENLYENLVKRRLQQESTMFRTCTREQIEQHRALTREMRFQLDSIRGLDKYSSLQAEHSRLQAEYDDLQVEHSKFCQLQAEHDSLQVKCDRLQWERNKYQANHRMLNYKYNALAEATEQTLSQQQKQNMENAELQLDYDDLKAAYRRLLLYSKGKPEFLLEVVNALKGDNGAMGADLIEKTNKTGAESGNSGVPKESSPSSTIHATLFQVAGNSGIENGDELAGASAGTKAFWKEFTAKHGFEN